MRENPDLQNSFHRMQILLGILGLALPLILFFSEDELLPSMSHYYYSRGSVFFIGILASFGLFLIAYKGYKKKNKEALEEHNMARLAKGKKEVRGERFADDIVTTIGGIAILIVLIIPTRCGNIFNKELTKLCEANIHPGFGHNLSSYGTIHLIAAGIFLIAMGWMCFDNFSQGGKNKMFFKVCGFIMWVCVGFLIFEFALEGIIGELWTHSVFWMEFIAVIVFGIAWLLKSKPAETLGIIRSIDS